MSRRDKKEKKKKSIGKVIIILLFLIILMSGICFGYIINQNGGGLQGFLATILGQNVEELQDLDTINVLVLRC